MKTKIKEMCAKVWCHRAMYGGLALAYGAGAFGLIDKEVVGQIATACYVAMLVQAH